MTSELTIHESADFGSIRAFEDEGQAFFVASDVAKVLGYRDAANMTRYLRDTEKGTRKASTPGGDQEVSVITEAGFFHALNNRRTAAMGDGEARERVEAFQDWVNGEVLPSIRRHGGYVNPYGAESDEEVMARGLAAAHAVLARLDAERSALQSENDAMRPKAALGEAVSAAADCCSVGDLARLLHQNGCGWAGRNRVYARMREDGFLISRGPEYNRPRQRYVEQGLFEVQESTYTANGEVRTSFTTRVTPKGQAYFLDRYAHVRTLEGMAIS